MTTIDHDNEMFRLAVDLVNQSNRNIFLTGKAGTGKTTFLRYIREHSLKQIAVVAPTGVAAINAGGTTIHSFFQLPFSPFLPEASGSMHQPDANNKHTLFGKIKLNRDRIKVIQQLELLIIDEISMVRCDLLDAIDAVLRHFRYRQSEPFGGVQVLLIGDMYQLPPVAVDHEWSLLSKFYNSPYFFDSRIMQAAPPVYVEFNRIYRQSDAHFIGLLNQVRNNAISAEGIQMLEALLRPDYPKDKETGYITLTTHNYKADAINMEALASLPSGVHSFKASIDGEFNEKAYPAEELLQLKEGAQVMFIKNDKERIKRYYNGKIGIITRINEEGIYVQCKDEADEIKVEQETWENIRYSVDKSTNQLAEDVIGSFKQYPLRLAWAITIHKSQGLTFEKAVIDAGGAFAAGQVYVALSRCTTLDGIVLRSRITSSSLRSDPAIVQFSSNIASTDRLKEELNLSRKIYQQQLLLAVFDVKLISGTFHELKKLLLQNQESFNEGAMQWCNQLEERLSYVQDITTKFKAHLNKYFADPMTPEANNNLQGRTKNASVFFGNELDGIIQLINAPAVVTESKLQAKQFNDTAKELLTLVAEKRHIIWGFKEGFSVEVYYRQKKSFQVPAATINVYATAAAETRESLHPALHFQLRALRNKICEQKNLPVYLVASGKSIDEMVMYLPQTKEALTKITGFGKAKVNQFGEKFIELIVEYCNEHGLSSSINTKLPKKEKKEKTEGKKKVDTKTITYELFQQGKTVEEIAAERKLTTQTIEGHLSFFVSKGNIAVEQLVPKEKLLLIEPHIVNRTDNGIVAIKEKLGNAVSFGEIRLTIAAMDWENSRQITQEPR